MRIEMVVAVVATALLAGSCGKRTLPGPEFTAIEDGFQKWLGEETKLQWTGSGGSGGDGKSIAYSFDFVVLDDLAMPSGGPDWETQRERWVRSHVDRDAVLTALRTRTLSALQSNGCRVTGSGEHGEGKSLQSFSTRFESGDNVGGVEVASYKTAYSGLTIHVSMWEAER